jgi:hypothetical protein
LIDASYGTYPSSCGSSPDTSPASVGFNGILGVGLFVQDCGSYCVTQANNNTYYACNTAGCTPTTASLAQQVSNPVAYLPTDNNGVILQLPNISYSGATGANGYLILGIGTGGRADNTPQSGVTVFPTDANGNFQTYYQGQNYPGSFIDSGSNTLYYPDSSLPQCTGGSGDYCPASLASLSATQVGAQGSPADIVPFQIANANQLLSVRSNLAFNDLGSVGSSFFDWGLPFFYGKSVYVGIETANSPLGTGPLWGF